MNLKFLRNIKLIVLFSLFTIHYSLFTQDFSVLTCDAGEEAYSTFGHSAIRYVDSTKGIDWVYNYGLFDFSDPNFIPKFCMGRLDYMVGKESMNDFMSQYVYQKRTVYENRLALTEVQRDSLYKFLEWNILDANKYYRYDFLFNNCATKIIEVLEDNCPGIQLNIEKGTINESFRDMIHRNAKQTVPWIDWGMDIGIGSPTDRMMTHRELCFLPYYVSKAVAYSKNLESGQNLSEDSSLLLSFEPHQPNLPAYLHPIFFALIVLFVSVIHFWKNPKWTRIFRGIFFLLLGLGGLVVGFEWFITEHTVTKNNWNFGWLNPVSIIYGLTLLINKEIKWSRLLVLIGFTITSVGWIFNMQDFHFASKLIIIAGFFFLIPSFKDMLKSKISSNE